MYSIFLCQFLFVPGIHRFESSHNLELIPNYSIVIISKAIKHLTGEKAVPIHFIICVSFAPHFAVTVIIGDKNKCAVWID